MGISDHVANSKKKESIINGAGGNKQPELTRSERIYKEVFDSIKKQVVESMIENSNVEITDKELIDEIRRLARKESEHVSFEEQEKMTREIFDSIVRLGALQPLMDDDSISDIMVNQGGDQIFVDRYGRLELLDYRISREETRRIIDRIAATANRHVDEASPMLDCATKNGSRVNITIPPISMDGDAISIRKFPENPFRINDLISNKTMSTQIANFLEIAVRARANIVVSGGTGSGKTTLLNVLTEFIPEGERILTIEDSAELKIQKAHVVRLESRPPNSEGKGTINIRDCVVNALRQRPDRIVVGECRSSEVIDMLQAMNTGHDGSLTTVHANNPVSCISRLETMFLMGGVDMPVSAIRKQIVEAVDIIVQIQRLANGGRKITSVTCLPGSMEGDTVTTEEIFTYDTNGHHACGITPNRIIEKCNMKGIRVPRAMFQRGTR